MRGFLIIIIGFSLWASSLRGAEFRADASSRRLLLNEKPFFWLGDTAWLLVQIPARDELELYLSTRARQGFTVIQFTAAMAEERVWGTTRATTLDDKPFLDNNPRTPAVTSGKDPKDPVQYDYWDHLDYVLDRIHAHGMRAAIVAMFVGYQSEGYKYLTNDNAFHYGRFLGERFKLKPQIIWILGGDNVPETPKEKELWDSLAKGLTLGVAGEEDYSKTFMTYHVSGVGSSSKFLHSAPWLDFNMAQTWDTHPAIFNIVYQDYLMEPFKPCGLGEGAYEDGPQYPSKPINGLVIRQQAYRSCFAGGYHTYGNGNVWHFGTLRSELTQTWKDALQSEGARQMIILKRFFESVGWSRFRPDPKLLVDQSGAGNLNCAMRSETGDSFIFYITHPREFKTKLPDSKPGTEFLAEWLNPATGEKIPLKNFQASFQGSLPASWNDGLLTVSHRMK